jgi:hypothetical protein
MLNGLFGTSFLISACWPTSQQRLRAYDDHSENRWEDGNPGRPSQYLIGLKRHGNNSVSASALDGDIDTGAARSSFKAHFAPSTAAHADTGEFYVRDSVVVKFGMRTRYLVVFSFLLMDLLA